MRKVILIALFAFPALAADGYKFHIKVTDARTALLANPSFAELKLSHAQLERAADDRVMMLNDTKGTHWIWLMLSWLKDKPDVEQGINSRGGASPDKDADIGLIPNEGGTIRTRCLHEVCRIHVTTSDRKESTVTLKKNESKDLPLDADFDLAFER